MSTIFDTPVYLNQRDGIPTQYPLIDVQAEMRKQRRGLATVVWANGSKENHKRIPAETVFVDNIMAGIPVPDYSDPALDMRKARELNEKAAKDPSSTNIDKAINDPWYNDFWYNQALQHADIIKNGEEVPNAPGVFIKRAAGGIMTTTDSPAINTINVSQAIQGMRVQDYILVNAIDQESTPNLTLSIDQWNGFTVYQDIAEADSTFQQKGNFTRKTFGLKKDVGHIGISDEARLVPDRNIWDYHVRHVGQEMFKVKNIKVAIELLTAGITAGGTDWAAKTNGISDQDPIGQIRVAAKVIEANGGRVSRIVSGSDPLTDFQGNTNIKGPNEPVPGLNYGTRVTQNAHLPGIQWYADELATQTGIILFDPEAIKLLQGPVRTAMYRNEDRGIDGYITRDFNRVATIDDTLIRRLTGVSA
jgi:hypothetical protein